MYIKSVSVENIMAQIEAHVQNVPDLVVGIFIAEQSADIVQELLKSLRAREISAFGGFFPGLIAEGTNTDEGVILRFFESTTDPIVVKQLKRQDTQHTADQIMRNHNSEDDCCLVCLVDGFGSSAGTFLKEVYDILGSRFSYLGGGAGSVSLQQASCLFTDQGIVTGGAIICSIKAHVNIGVQHGWDHAVGPLVATKTMGNIVYEINWENAFDVYQRAIKDYFDEDLDRDDFLSVATSYPFGLYKEYDEPLVREPLFVGSRGELICIGEVPEHSVMGIMRGQNDKLIQAAAGAANQSLENGGAIQDVFVIDCISRLLYLKDDYKKEVDIMQAAFGQYPQVPQIEGILSIGEIASQGKGVPEFYNRTVVVAAFTA